MAKNRSECGSRFTEQDRALGMAELELHMFNGLRPDEASCIREVYRQITGSFETVCRQCGGKNTKELDDRSFFCLDCHKRCWFTADTPFFKFKKIRPWLFAQKLQKKGIRVTGSQLADLLKISKSTGYCIAKKVFTLPAGRTGEIYGDTRRSSATKDNLIRLREYKWLQEQLEGERRKETESVCFAEGQCLEQDNDSVQSSAVKIPAEMEAEEVRLLAALTDVPQNFDTLINKLDCEVPWMSAQLMSLELQGLVTRLAGDCYVKAGQAEELPQMTTKRARKEKASVCQCSMPVPLIVSIVDSMKLAWTDISKIITDQLRRLIGSINKGNSAATTVGHGRSV